MGEERETNQDGKEEESFERVGLSENEVLDHYEQDQQQLDPDERSATQFQGKSQYSSNHHTAQ